MAPFRRSPKLLELCGRVLLRNISGVAGCPVLLEKAARGDAIKLVAVWQIHISDDSGVFLSVGLCPGRGESQSASTLVEDPTGALEGENRMCGALDPTGAICGPYGEGVGTRVCVGS